MSQENSNFIKLSLEEMTLKLDSLAKQKEVLKLWKKGEDSHLYRVSDFTVLKSPESSDYLLSLFSEGKESDEELVGKKVLFTFNYNDSDYFSEGSVSHDDIHNVLVLRLSDNFYRSEKRGNERLLTFPHHQVYAYFKVLNEKNESNVIELKREEDKLYIDYKQKQKKELKERLKKKISDVEDLVGFRALDISRSGIAFIVNEDEAKYFSEGRKYSFYVLFDGDIFVVKGAGLVYKVDYVGGQGGVKRYKVGLNFNPVESLSLHITELLRESSGAGSIQKEFEDFVDE